MGNHIFIIDSEAIGKYISGLIDKKFKSSREFCHRWLKENNELTDNELKNEESIQNRANKLSQIKKGKKNIQIDDLPVLRVIRTDTQRGRFGSRTAETGVKLLHSTV